MAKDAMFHHDDGTQDIPGVDSPWRLWVSAARTRNYCNGDPLLDWLEEYGESKGLTRDNLEDGYDPRTDFLQFVFAKGNQFETTVIDHLKSRVSVIRIASEAREVREAGAAERTWDAMVGGAEVIAQAVLWNPETQTYGAADLLIRSDVLARLFPSATSHADADHPATHLPKARWHYRVVDVKFTTLDLLVDGHGSSEHKEYMAQVWLYNEALGRIQGWTPPSAYLLGRAWKQRENRGRSAMERLERVDREYVFGKKGPSLRNLALQGCDWVRRMRANGATWNILPTPSVPELRPNMRNTEDAPWHRAKQEMAVQTQDLTMIPRVSPELRNAAMASGLVRWSDPACTAERLGISGPTYLRQVNAVIAANHSPVEGPFVFPGKVTAGEPFWRQPLIAEFYVDFETVTDLNDDFSTFPDKGGQPLIFMIGCGYLADPADSASWFFRVFDANRLTQDEERRVITEWLAHMRQVCEARGTNLESARLFHWSHAEVSTFTDAYNSAAVRHGFPPWDNLQWVDLLKEVVKAQPVTVRGAFGFGLKPIAKAMHATGLIATKWGDGPTDGLGAMIGAWWCDAEAAKRGVELRELDLFQQVEAYNEVDCRVMAEVLHFLRSRR